MVYGKLGASPGIKVYESYKTSSVVIWTAQVHFDTLKQSCIAVEFLVLYYAL